MTNYLIRNGQVYEGGGGAGVRADVRTKDGAIDEIAPGLEHRGETIVDATGLLVTPGLIDLHVHVYSGMGLWSIEPEQAGLPTGVTTVLDTGTAGALTYPTFGKYIIAQAREDIFALLNISMIGCLQGVPDKEPRMGELSDQRYCDVAAAVDCIEANRERIVGVKVRCSAILANNVPENEFVGFEHALEVARRTATPLMVHHGGSNIPFAQVVDAMEPGDIFTHFFHPHPGGPFSGPDGGPSEALVRGRQRGVLFDVGHGAGGFGWQVAEAACVQHNFWPDTISTDLHQLNLHGPVYDMPTTLSKFLYLGMPLPQLIAAATGTPARAMGLEDRFGRLLPGRQADITLLELENGQWELADTRGQARAVERRLRARGVFKHGRYSTVESDAP